MPGTKKPYHHGNLRDALLEASLKLIREQGVRAFALREVARRAEVSHTAAYRHFRDKADLLAAIAEQGFDRLSHAMQRAATKATAPFERLQRAGLAYVEFAQNDPERFLVMFSITFSESLHPAAKAASQRCFGELLSLVTACTRPAIAIPIEALALLAWTTVHGVAELGLRGQLKFTNRKQLIQFAQLATKTFGRGAGLL